MSPSRRHFVFLFIIFTFAWFLYQSKQAELITSEDFSSQQMQDQDLVVEDSEVPDKPAENWIESAPNTTLPEGESELEKKLISFDPEAKLKILKNDNGTITTMRGFKIKNFGDTHESVLGLAKEMAVAMGFDAADIQLSDIKLDETPDSRALQYDQTYQGYDVYAGYIKMLVKKPEGFVYFATNELKELGDPDLRIDFDVVEAEQIALRKYAGKKNLRLSQRPSKPVLFSLRPKVSELVWRIELSWEPPMADRRQMMVSAKSGIILDDISMHSH